MDANKMPEMPEAALLTHRGTEGWTREQVEADRRACYLAGLEAAKACVPEVADEDAYQYDRAEQYGHNNCRNLTLTNLTALEQEAKK